MAWGECKEKDPQVAYTLGQMLQKMEQFKKAIRMLKACLKLFLAQQETYEIRFTDLNVTATAHSITNDTSTNANIGNTINSAVQINHKKVRVYYQQLSCYFMIGQSYVKLGRFERAVYPLTRCIELMPQNYKYFLARGKVYQNLQLFDQATADYTVVLNDNPNFAQVLFRRAFAYKAQNKFELAIADFEKARQIDPQNA